MVLTIECQKRKMVVTLDCNEFPIQTTIVSFSFTSELIFNKEQRLA